MGTLHRAFAVSESIALATASQIPGTVPNNIIHSSKQGIRIGHPSGIIYTEATVLLERGEWNVSRAAIGRTARRIMDGFAYVPSSIFVSDQGSEIERGNHSIQNV